eukprot:CAMPEP_0197657634 /NCGR_PEP_ID=MMETSP1338-20131121/44751_1 /TAXON_ID=43686 ORGANISM="Pelagodinium beii, Strain RCC1491" /NCGR_SAMPLE_ID=MMETSP1338 /ASSEMBLY_ACC=CAM_ASM_000754 /LENGTH=120 /DNA_ID=CAMNT_0043234049 /DNA_START=168 /DNA_END=526 /DNA_ORIENTATION=-
MMSWSLSAGRSPKGSVAPSQGAWTAPGTRTPPSRSPAPRKSTITASCASAISNSSGAATPCRATCVTMAALPLPMNAGPTESKAGAQQSSNQKVPRHSTAALPLRALCGVDMRGVAAVLG